VGASVMISTATRPLGSVGLGRVVQFRRRGIAQGLVRPHDVVLAEPTTQTPVSC